MKTWLPAQDTAKITRIDTSVVFIFFHRSGTFCRHFSQTGKSLPASESMQKAHFYENEKCSDPIMDLCVRHR